MKRPDGGRPPAPGRSGPTRGGEPEPDTEPIRIVSAIRVDPEPAERTPSRAGAVRRTLSGLRLPGAENRAVSRAARERRRYERGEVRRFTKRSRRRRLIALVVAGSLVALALIVGVAAFSPLMAVRTIEIAGTQRVDAAALQSELDDQLGVPLTLVDRDEVGRVLGASPLIQSYSVQTRPPSTLVVSIVERTPLGVIAAGGRFELVDAAGVVIETADSAQPGYPVLTTASGDASGAGFRATARVLRSLPASLAPQVTAATATTGDDVSLTLQNGTEVVWGGSDESALKAVVLEKLMAATDPAVVGTYDVSSPQAAVVAPRP
ncbi:cell division protein FtsQ/DivIB [Rathayibacter sp. AY1A7]|uniref:cell division protein FtsQ/DivIB n=1 Tax=Rathayibacter sp. AY1A7 TaxID=2080524 RepID=UPI000CE8B371|nr:cell division protein FtsQ/DivIB [Rathayibacter sp. AY1A7]PPF19341.1 cell division protein FtsQ [Rathayibacter sp. AY1A7]